MEPDEEGFVLAENVSVGDIIESFYTPAEVLSIGETDGGDIIFHVKQLKELPGSVLMSVTCHPQMKMKITK